MNKPVITAAQLTRLITTPPREDTWVKVEFEYQHPIGYPVSSKAHVMHDIDGTFAQCPRHLGRCRALYAYQCADGAYLPRLLCQACIVELERKRAKSDEHQARIDGAKVKRARKARKV